MINLRNFIVGCMIAGTFAACNQKNSGSSRRNPSATNVDCSVPNPPAECNKTVNSTTGTGDQTPAAPTCQAQTTQAACGLVSGCNWNGTACVSNSTTTTPTTNPSELCGPLNTQAKCQAAPGCSWDGSACKISGLSAAPQPMKCSPLTTSAECGAAIGCTWSGSTSTCTRPGVGLGVSFEKGDGLSAVGTSNNPLQNCNFSAIFAADGNFVVYQGSNVIWSTSTGGKNAVRAQFQADGNFVIATSSSVLFDTKTTGKAADGFALGKNGNLVVLNTSKQVIWQSGSIINGCY